MQENSLKLLIKKILRLISKSDDINKTTLYLINKHFNIKLGSRYNTPGFVFSITVNNFKYINDYNIDTVRFKNELMQNDLNSTEGINKIKRFKSCYKYYMDSDGNQYYKNISTDNFEFSSIITEFFDESKITTTMSIHPSVCYLYNNDNFYFLTNDDEICVYDNKREDIKIVHNGEHYSFRKIYKLNDMTYNIKGKDWVKYYMYNPNEIGKLYFLKMIYDDTIFYKVGITKHDVTSRYRTLPKSIKILGYEEYEMSMLKASIIERYMHYKYKHLQEIPNIHFEGKTECFYNNINNYYKDDKESILIKSIEHIAMKCNLSCDIIYSILKFKEGIK